MKRSLLLSLLLAGCATPPQETPSPRVALDPLALPPVKAALTFPPGASEVTLRWLLDELARLTGQELTMAPPVARQVEQLAERLEITTPVPADEVYPFVEALLAAHDFVIAPVKSGTRPVLGVYGSGPPHANAALQPVVIEAEQLDALAAHPALVCRVVLVFENLDSRQLQTQLRQLLVDTSRILQCVPAGERGLILQAPGAQLAGLARLLLDVDRVSRARPAVEPSPARGPGPAGPSKPPPAGG